MPAAFPGNSTTKLARSDGAGGFESAIEAAGSTGITGTVAHGNTVTLTDSESRLGTRSNAPFRHWQAGSEIYLNGTQSTAEVGASNPDLTEIWGSYSGGLPIVTDRLRHGRLDQQYRATGKGSLIDPKAFDNIGGEEKLYYARWVRNSCNIVRTYVYGYSNLSGPFITTPSFYGRGEAITVSLLGGGTRSGWILGIIGDSVTFETTSTLSEADAEGATITGDVSGETLTISQAVESGGAAASSKIFRTYSGDAISGLGTIVTRTHQGRMIIQGYNADGTYGGLLNDATDYGWGAFTDTPETWRLIELEIDFSGSTGVVRERIDNVVTSESTGITKAFINDVRGFYTTNTGLDTSGVPDSKAAIVEEWGEQIFDNDLKRIVIGDAATLDACTQIEIQRHTSWSAGSVDFVVNQGGFDDLSGKYVFAVDGGYSELLGVAL